MMNQNGDLVFFMDSHAAHLPTITDLNIYVDTITQVIVLLLLTSIALL